MEVFVDKHQKRWAVTTLEKIAAASRGHITTTYTGNDDWLVICGWGGQNQQDCFYKHRAKGGNVIVVDASYFKRKKNSFRISVNCFHPYNQLQYAPINSCQNRMRRLEHPITNTYDPNGHVLLLGLTSKTCKAYNYGFMDWDRNMQKQIEQHYPGKPIIYRPKSTPQVLHRTIDGSSGTIYDRLNKCSLAVVHHSNVALDCAMVGVPCIAVDGIGKLIYSNSFDEPLKIPSLQERQRFISQVTWFDWEDTECGEMIKFAKYIKEKVDENSPGVW